MGLYKPGGEGGSLPGSNSTLTSHCFQQAADGWSRSVPEVDVHSCSRHGGQGGLVQVAQHIMSFSYSQGTLLVIALTIDHNLTGFSEQSVVI